MERLCETKILDCIKNVQQTACAHVSLTGLGGKSVSRWKISLTN